MWHKHITFGWHAERCVVCDTSTSFLWTRRQKCSMWHIHRRFPWSHSQKARCDVYRSFLPAYSRRCRYLRPPACCDCGFESRRGHVCLSLVIVVCCQVEVSSSRWSLVQRIPTDCGVSEWGALAQWGAIVPWGKITISVLWEITEVLCGHNDRSFLCYAFTAEYR